MFSICWRLIVDSFILSYFRSAKTYYSEEVSKSELKDLENKYYNELKNGVVDVRASTSTYRCPYCPGKSKTDYILKELLQHATGIGRGSQRSSLKEKARHLALESYIRKYLDLKGRAHDELFVWPWMGIVANIKTTLVGGQHVGESGSKLRDELTREGFNPVRVHPLWNRGGHSGFAIVEFNKDWAGFQNAIAFEKRFQVDHCGKEDYYVEKNRGEKLFGWMAREDDYKSRGIVSDHLCKHGDLKSLSGIEAEDQRKTSKLVSNLTDTLGTKNLCLKEMASKYVETSDSLKKLIEQKDYMIKMHNDGILFFLFISLFSLANSELTINEHFLQPFSVVD